MTDEGDLYEWACNRVDEGDLAIIVVRGDSDDDRVVDGFTLEVTEEGRTEGVETDELVGAVVKCHEWAAGKDAE